MMWSMDLLEIRLLPLETKDSAAAEGDCPLPFGNAMLNNG